MPFRRLSCLAPSRAAFTLALSLLLAACERKPTSRDADSASPDVAAARRADSPARDRSGWNAAAGPALLVEGATPDEAIVLYPFRDDTLDQERLDAASTDGDSVALFGRGGARFAARLGALPDDANDDCERWRLRDVRAEGRASSWAVGFVQAQVSPIPLDSVHVLSPRDSMALAAEVSRLASSVTAPTSPSFQGLRFSAHDMRRFDASPGVQAIVAHVIRRVNQEASPLEEQTLLVAERDSGVTSGPYVLAFAERGFGPEEQATAPEVLSALRFGGSAQPTLIVAHDNERGVVYSMLERTGRRVWRMRWTSAPAQCN